MVKHREIFNSLKNDINGGQHPSGSRLPSEEALCRRWQVSRPTVRRALRDLQAASLIRIKAGSGCYVQENLHTTHPTFGLLVESLGKTEILDPIHAEITRAAQTAGCTVFGAPLPAEQSAREIAQAWVKRGIRGVIFAPIEHSETREQLNLEIIGAFQQAGAAVVLVDRDAVEFPKRSNCDLVSLDNFHAGYILGQHLITRGCRSVAFVAKPNFPSSTDLRCAGLQNAVLRGGGRKTDFIVGDTKSAKFIVSTCNSRAQYDAVVCSNDLTAAQFLQGAIQNGKQVPRDFLLAGFDDVSYAPLLSTPLTTIRQPCASIGSACIHSLLERIQHPEQPPRSILFEGELIVRASTGARR
jgi:DNA-binding LacI/PurR family transcriptional regulator